MPKYEPISKDLPPGVDQELKYIADATGRITYDDIRSLGKAWPDMAQEKKNAVAALLAHIDDLCSGSMLDPDETMRSDDACADAVTALCEIVKPAKN